MLKKISSREVYRNKWCTLREDVTERKDGTRGIYGVLSKYPACIMIPIEHTEDGDYVWLVKQYRYTVGKSFFELPQGAWEESEVIPEELARGELREETGMSAGKMTHLGDNWIAYGAMHQIHHVYLAEELVAGETDRDEEEFDMTVHRVKVSEFEAMMLDGTVMDNCSLAAWCLYKLWLGTNSR